MSRKEIIKVPVGTGHRVASARLRACPGELDAEFEERWTGGYIFENEWQSFRTRQKRDLELTTAPHLRQARSLHRRRQGHRHLRQRHDDAGAGECGIVEVPLGKT